MKLIVVLLATVLCATCAMSAATFKNLVASTALNPQGDATATERMLEQQVLAGLRDSLTKANEVRAKLAGGDFDRIKGISEKLEQLYNNFAKALGKSEAAKSSGGPASSNPTGESANQILVQLNTIAGNMEGVNNNIMRFVKAAEDGNQENIKVVGKLNVVTNLMLIGDVNVELVKLRAAVNNMKNQNTEKSQSSEPAWKPPIKICFTENTPITMADGSARIITDVRVGDEVEGGTVIGVMQFSAAGVNIFDYKGVQVAEGHKVLENGNFLPVEQTQHAKLMLGLNPRFIYNLDTTGHRLSIRNMTFADFEEVPLSRRVDSIKLDKLNN